MFTIGSLFDGSGGFPLAAFLCGGVPVWAAEIEPYPIAVTRTRFPHMKHLGSVTDVNGAEIEPVDLITFGSPCQDLSVAGKRAGLKHTENGDEETTRSGLFMEAVRIIKEMREATNGVYPRFALWENVPGAFSSNKGEDFRIVLEELIKLVEPEAVMPPVPKNGWSYADHYCGDGWSLAYRTLDSQYWGVPQRRNRIHLVVDFGGQCAREVLFERGGVRGYFAEGRTPWQATAGNAEDSAGADDRAGENGGGAGRGRLDGIASAGFKPGQGPKARGIGWEEEKSPTLAAEAGGNSVPAVCYGVTTKGNGDAFISQERCATLAAGGGMPGQGYAAALVPYTLKVRCGKEGGGKGALIQTDKSATLATNNDQYLFQPICMATQQGGAEIRTDDKAPTVTAAAGMSGNNQPVVALIDSIGGQAERGWEGETAPTLKATHYKSAPCVAYAVENHPADSRVDIDESGKVQTLTSRMGTGGGNVPMVLEPKAYGIGNGQANQSFSEERVGALNCMHDQQAVSYAVDCRNLREIPEVYQTLQAKPNGGQSLNFSGAVRIRYIVRRLTPTECARLQGFPDGWGHPDPKTSFTDEDYEFWLDVRNTHAAINGKAVKNYTKDQMLTWYNKLHTDSSEYKMWGNGIALPTALYVMQGIAAVLTKQK